MKDIFQSLLLATALIALVSCAKEPSEQPEAENTSGPMIVNASSQAVNGEIILKLKPEATAVAQQTRAAGASGPQSGIDQIDRILNTVNAVKFERLFPACGRFEERTHKEGLDRWFFAQYDPTVPTRELAKMLAVCPDIEIIEYSLATTTADYQTRPTLPTEAQTQAASTIRNIAFPFNESTRSQALQWHYNNPGKVFTCTTTVGADADVYAAWTLCTGNPDVIVAVVDQGVKFDHEDLAANMWANQAELNGTQGVDEDGNGYVDDIHGYNFSANSGMLNFSDQLNHGTHVAGTIAAVNNNGIGVCGIAGGSGKNDGVKIMSCEILGASASSASGAGLSGSIKAIKYAADNGAVVCQNSWGYTAGTISETDWRKGSYSALSRAIAYFIKYAGVDEKGNQVGPMKGGLVTFAAGNDGMNDLSYPAADPNVISVAATGFRGNPSSFTNYGKWVSLSAPGGDQALNTAYGAIYSTSVDAAGKSDYVAMQGTSMACPHVSGACALAISYYYGAEKRKGLTPDMLKQALLSSTRPIDSFCTGNYAAYLGLVGVGSLDTYQMLLAISKTAAIPAQKVSVAQTVTLDLNNYFTATNVLIYTVSDPDIVEVTLSAGVLKLKGLRKGQTTVIVSDGRAIRRTIEVTVA